MPRRRPRRAPWPRPPASQSPRKGSARRRRARACRGAPASAGRPGRGRGSVATLEVGPRSPHRAPDRLRPAPIRPAARRRPALRPGSFEPRCARPGGRSLPRCQASAVARPEPSAPRAARRPRWPPPGCGRESRRRGDRTPYERIRGPARGHLQQGSLPARVSLGVPLEGQVVDDRERAPRPCEGHGVGGDEEQVGTACRQGQRQPHLRPHAVERRHRHIEAEPDRGPRGEERPRQVGRDPGQARADLARVDLGAGSDFARGRVDVDRDASHAVNDHKPIAVQPTGSLA